MSTPFYVDLFYEDIGFTNDYSNVLQFDSKEDREAYFDNLAHYHIENSQFNNMNIEGNSVKLAFYDLLNVDFDKINYIRIATRLFGSSTTIDTLEYGFIIDYSVISSAEDCTVVEFVFEKDIWQNYQFNFILKECNVERSHIDRWGEGNNPIYTRPSNDLLDTYMLISKKVELVDISRYISGTTTEEPLYTEEELAWCFFTYTTDENNSASVLRVAFFPISLSEYNREITYEEIYDGESSVIGYDFPRLGEVLEGNLSHCFGVAPSSIYNVSILFHTGIRFNPQYTSISNYKNEIYGTHKVMKYRQEQGSKRWAAFYIDTDTLAPLNNMPWQEDEIHEVNGSMPIKPINGSDYSVEYEPMMYKSPVMERYVTNSDGSQSFKIPDIKMMDVTDIYIKTLISPSEAYNIISLTSLDNDSVAGNVLISAIGQINSEQCDIINSYWQEYCITQRDADRKMMWANILTGGISDAGSTGISAGIGYRANQERAEMANIQRRLVDGRTKYGRALKAESQMYSTFAKQAAGMSIAGGGVQLGANAVRTYIGQETKESAIKNKPAALTKTGNWFGKITSGIYKTEYVELKCDEKSYEQYANIFKKFGYFIGGVITPNIKSRKYFNYIKTAGAILTGNVNQSILANLAVLFDKGMTIWHMDCTTKNTLYKYDKENIERTLMVADYHYTEIETVENWNEAVSHLDIMKVGSRLRIVGTSGTDRLQSISWRNVNTDVWNANAGSPYTACDITFDTAGTYEIYGTFKINGEFVDTNITRFKVIE